MGAIRRMTRSISLVVFWQLAVAVFPAAAADQVVSAPPRTPEEEIKAFHLPPGFEAQLVASEPDIHKPINIAFDDRGRLWVTDTVEYPFPAPDNREPARRGIPSRSWKILATTAKRKRSPPLPTI